MRFFRNFPYKFFGTSGGNGAVLGRSCGSPSSFWMRYKGFNSSSSWIEAFNRVDSGRDVWTETSVIFLNRAAARSAIALLERWYLPPMRTEDTPVPSTPIRGSENATVPSFSEPSEMKMTAAFSNSTTLIRRTTSSSFSFASSTFKLEDPYTLARRAASFTLIESRLLGVGYAGFLLQVRRLRTSDYIPRHKVLRVASRRV